MRFISCVLLLVVLAALVGHLIDGKDYRKENAFGRISQWERYTEYRNERLKRIQLSLAKAIEEKDQVRVRELEEELEYYRKHVMGMAKKRIKEERTLLATP